MAYNTPETKRLYVGGLFSGATPEDLKDRFGKYGTVKSVDMKVKKNDDGEVVNTFAFIDFNSTPAKIRQCIDIFNKTKWKGKELKIQVAKESFMDRLEKERQSVVKTWSPEKKATNEVDPHEAIVNLKVRGPPGTAVPSKEGWVVGKYNEIVPVLQMKKDGKTTVVFDPSKNCHGIKRLDNNDDLPKVNIDQLTWELEEKPNPANNTNLKSSKKKKQAVKSRKSLDSNSRADSEAQLSKSPETRESVMDSFDVVVTPNQFKDDSDNESRGSCDTDEIIRRTRSGGKQSAVKEDISFKYTEPLDALYKTMAFSEFDSGFTTPKTKKGKLEKKVDDDDEDDDDDDDDKEDVFDLISSGKVNELLKKSELPMAGEATQSRKRKKSDLENPKKKLQKVDDVEAKSSSLKADEDKVKPEVSKMSTGQNKNKPDKTLEKHLESVNSDKMADTSEAPGTSEKRKKRKRSEVGEEEDAKRPDHKQSKIDDAEDGKSRVKSQKMSDAEDKTLEITDIPEISVKSEEKQKKKKIKKGETVEKSLVEGSETFEKGNKTCETLQSVVSPPKTSLQFQDFQSFRYDPSAADHEKFEIKDLKDKSKPNQMKKEETVKHVKTDEASTPSKKEETPKPAKKEKTPKSSKKETPEPNEKEETAKPAKKEKTPKSSKKGEAPELITKEETPKKEKTPKSSKKEETLKPSEKQETPKLSKKEETPKQKKEKQPKQVQKSETKDKPAAETEIQRFAEVDASVVDAFKETSDAPFSLGALFGDADENLSEEETVEEKPVQGNWKKAPKVVIEENSDDELETAQQSSKTKPSKETTTVGGFFYHSNDPRLKEFKFYREKDLEEIRTEWLERRPQLIDAYLNKKKKPIRPYGKAPKNSKKTRGNKTEESDDETQAPGNKTKAPWKKTQARGNKTQEPRDETQAPGKKTQAPWKKTQSPWKKTFSKKGKGKY